MKNKLTILLIAAFAFASTNCTTSYDAYGNERQSVDPGTAVAGAAAAGVLGYALADRKKSRNKHYYHNNRRHHNHRYHRNHRRRF